MTDEKIVEMWNKAYTSSKPVRETLLDVYEKGIEDGRAEAIEEFRRYLKTVTPCEMPQEMWDMGVDNTCDRMLRGERE